MASNLTLFALRGLVTNLAKPSLVVHRPRTFSNSFGKNEFRPLLQNKAVYTPPSRGRVGRSGIAKNTLTFCWAGAEMPKLLANQKWYGPTNRPTNQPTDTASSRVVGPRLKTVPPQCRAGGQRQGRTSLGQIGGTLTPLTPLTRSSHFAHSGSLTHFSQFLMEWLNSCIRIHTVIAIKLGFQ